VFWTSSGIFWQWCGSAVRPPVSVTASASTTSSPVALSTPSMWNPVSSAQARNTSGQLSLSPQYPQIM
jgi:hypothetical protein